MKNIENENESIVSLNETLLEELQPQDLAEAALAEVHGGAARKFFNATNTLSIGTSGFQTASRKPGSQDEQAFCIVNICGSNTNDEGGEVNSVFDREGLTERFENLNLEGGPLGGGGILRR